MSTFENRSYIIKEIIDENHLHMSRATFLKFIKRENKFPPPFYVCGNMKRWDGTAIQYWIDKKSGR
ncbi:helix-turn-helix transcriptional regulator [Leuconostoc gasicomitatum]|uniref:helix-turn-helix transcriptional regulator n=1 Tax=Leuconostoc gasicomitatum TaxID=115778 RepID=UPI000744BFAF|nr:hypothetical protein [Leuconostoc gasicomitatum]CUR63920.1 Putative phage transcriptional regulator [Leuconostoc gasicomitatum KG16-1]